MPEVIAPELGAIERADAEKWAQTFGGICRIALAARSRRPCFSVP